MAEAETQNALELMRMDFKRVLMEVLILWRSFRVRCPTGVLIEPLSSESSELSDYQALLARLGFFVRIAYFETLSAWNH